MKELVGYIRSNALVLFQLTTTVTLTILVMWDYNVKANMLANKEKNNYLKAVIIFALFVYIEGIFNVNFVLKGITLLVILPTLVYFFTGRHPYFTIVETIYFIIVDCLGNIITAFFFFIILKLPYSDFGTEPTVTIGMMFVYITSDWLLYKLLHKPVGSHLYNLRNNIWKKQRNSIKTFILYLILLLTWCILAAYFLIFSISKFGLHMQLYLLLIAGVLTIIMFIILATMFYQRNRFEKLKEVSMYDELTKAINRKFGLQYIDKLLKSKKEGFVLCYIDLNSLKQINDEMGHQYGDDLICFQIDILRETIGEKSTIIRMGGDEFILVFQLETKDSVTTLMDAALCTMSDRKPECFDKYRISFSYGIAEYNTENPISDPMELIAKADSLMYDYKKKYKQILAFETK